MMKQWRKVKTLLFLSPKISTSFLVNLKPFVASFKLPEDAHRFPEEPCCMDVILLRHDEMDTV